MVISTRNRRDELHKALSSAFSQSVPVEVLVIDDGSTDGTAAMVGADFPRARVVHHPQSRGYIVRRNEGVRAASTNIVISMDDDAIFSHPDTVRQTVREFSNEQIGAVAMPYVDVNRGPEVRQRAPGTDAIYVTDRFIGTAHALRRDVFLRVGGYREDLVHQGEEGDYCVRMLECGYIVRLGSAEPIHHFESPRRDFSRMDYFGARNALLFAWQNVPMPFVMWHLPVVALRVLNHTWRPKRLATRLSGMLAALTHFGAHARKPIAADTYRLARSLAAGPRPIEDVALSVRTNAV